MRIDAYNSIDFRQMLECISYHNCFIEEMDIDNIRQFKNLIDWNFAIVSHLSKRTDFKEICKEFKEEIKEVYQKWEFDLDELTKEEWKECLK